GSRGAPGGATLLRLDPRLGDALAPPAVLLRDEHRQPAKPRHFRDEVRGVLAVRFQIAPVLAGKPRANLADRVPDEHLVRGQREVHAQSEANPGPGRGSGTRSRAAAVPAPGRAAPASRVRRGTAPGS